MERLIRLLVNEGYIGEDIVFNKDFGSSNCYLFVKRNSISTLIMDFKSTKSTQPKLQLMTEDTSGHVQELYKILTGVRQEVADKTPGCSTKPFLIMPNTAIYNMAKVMPQTIQELYPIPEIPKIKSVQFGSYFIEAIKKFVLEKGITPKSANTSTLSSSSSSNNNSTAFKPPAVAGKSSKSSSSGTSGWTPSGSRSSSSSSSSGTTRATKRKYEPTTSTRTSSYSSTYTPRPSNSSTYTPRSSNSSIPQFTSSSSAANSSSNSSSSIRSMPLKKMKTDTFDQFSYNRKK